MTHGIETQGTGSLEAMASTGDAVVPRWEWRIFGHELRARVRRLIHAPAGELSAEMYVLSARSVHNARIRRGRLEVKRLERTDHGGLELWRPVLVEPFPVGAGVLQRFCAVMGLPAVAEPGDPLTAAAFLEGFVTAAPGLTRVSVTKRTTPVVERDCPGEFAELTVDGAPWEGVAFESVSPERVVAAVQSLGFAVHDNTNYPAALKRIVGLAHVDDTARPRC